MTINAKHVTPGQAIKRTLMLARGMQDLAKGTATEKGDPSALLSVYYEGEPGVGKSAIPKAIAKAMNYKFVDRRANMLNPDDAGGTRMQDMETKTTVWFPPEWMPAEDGSVQGLNSNGQPYDGTVLFFDELASADDRVRKPLFGIFLDRCLNERGLPDNCLVFAAGNEAETGTMVFELDNATRTRFITMRVIADFDSWLQDFAPSALVTPTTVSYLKQNGHRFCETETAMNETKTQKRREIYGNPRSWDQTSKIERSIMRTEADRRDQDKLDALETMVAGKIGVELAAEYMGVFVNVAEMANLYDLLKATKEERKVLWPSSIGQLYALSYSMMSFPKDIPTGKQIFELMEDMPKNSNIPFEEMKTPIREIILKRLREGGIKESDLNKAFAKGSIEATAELFANGPLLDLTGGR